jgi:hypothetical protein
MVLHDQLSAIVELEPMHVLEHRPRVPQGFRYRLQGAASEAVGH